MKILFALLFTVILAASCSSPSSMKREKSIKDNELIKVFVLGVEPSDSVTSILRCKREGIDNAVYFTKTTLPVKECDVIWVKRKDFIN